MNLSNAIRCSWDFCLTLEQCSKKWHPAKTLSELRNPNERMLSCLEFQIIVTINYMWQWAEGRVEGIRCFLTIKYQPWNCSGPGGFIVGDAAVQSEPSVWEISIADDRKRYFVDNQPLVFFQRQREKKILSMWQPQVTTYGQFAVACEHSPE